MINKSLVAAAIASLIAAGTAQAETLKVSTAAPNGTPWVKHLEKSAANLAEISGGALTMEVFPASQLGAETDTIKQTARGRLAAGNFSITAVASVVPEVSMLVTPFFWDSFEQADCALDEHLVDTFDALFQERGLRLVQWHELGWQNLFTNEPISGPADVKGLKMRVGTSDNHDMYWRSAEVSGVPMPFSDIATNLQTGLVEGGELPTISYVAGGVGKISPHMTRTRHIYQPSVFLMSTKVWDSLSEEERAQFNEAQEPAQALRTAVRGAIDFFSKKHIDEGGTISELTDEQRAEWAALWTDEKMQELIKATGGDAQRVYDEVVAARDACTTN
ncbi:TRAP transporter substrate-binding protein [Phaeobacter italicus]|uniref:TRAP transporter substrate-binding protein n=1 Tax=Phaeobacter italicus TaxID=481446 RepID=UPI00242B20C1|nr:TRAP transporter substrate-binding protein DctP [Phaeobacter italicus]MCI5102125.1 TRAP transporter substrate-binding protein DctP [Phaeobacter italicus]